MKKLVAAGVGALAIGMVAPAPSAGAPVQAAQAADQCASKAEYRTIKLGMTRKQVTRIIGHHGTRTFFFPPYETREYASCKSAAGFVMVSFERQKVTQKTAVWG